MNAEAAKTGGIWGGVVDWVKSQWDKVNFEEWSKSLGDSSSDAVQVAIYFVSSFAIGFLFKKYLKFVIACLLVAFLIIKGLEYQKILDIDWQAFNTLLGFEPNATFGTMVNTWITWVRLHLLIVISSVVGFLIGYKLG